MLGDRGAHKIKVLDAHHGVQSVIGGAGNKRERGARAFDLLPQQEQVLLVIPLHQRYQKAACQLAHLVRQATAIANNDQRILPHDEQQH